MQNRDKFPQGADTQVGERGVKLSGGEKQRVSIARAYIALLHNAHVLVLDEATSSLDSESERIIQTMIEKLRKAKPITVVVVAHRLSTIHKADCIFVIEDGKIVEQGDHKTLTAIEGGVYNRLNTLQQTDTVAA